ncbi:MAG: DUF3311 domain-containing protein [Actinobacteria bacterium]|nr:DUF3311 domain-containing protein [Actinomycetota bacterium]MBI3686646.1 DUF3311 domain-containing protein [Actinomycetota bacterium]
MATETQRPTPPEPLERRPQPSTTRKVAAALLLLPPIIALMWVGSYAKATPRLLGFPFFYWYQLMWLLIGSVCTALAYQLLRTTRPPSAADPGSGRATGSDGVRA